MRRTGLLLTATLLASCVGRIESEETRRKVADMTASELNVLCDWIDDAVSEQNASESEMCTLAAVQGTESASACSNYVNECVSVPEAGRYRTSEVCSKKKKVAPRGCTVTVRQLKSCLTAQLQEDESAAMAANCFDLYGSRPPGSKLVPCIDVLPACNSLFGVHGSAGLDVPESDDDDWFDEPWDEFDGGLDYPDEEPTDEEPADEEPVPEEPVPEEPIPEEPAPPPPPPMDAGTKPPPRTTDARV
jgi:hypothetical protein